MRASTLAVDPPVRRAAQELLVQALALSGRADECLALGAQLLASLSLLPVRRVGRSPVARPGRGGGHLVARGRAVT